MVGTRTLAACSTPPRPPTTKVVLVGDHHQLPEIDAGGAFAGLANRLPAIELTDNRRQSHDWERDALDELRDGDVGQAVAAYRVPAAASTSPRPSTRSVSSSSATGGRPVDESGTDALMVAARIADIDDLNARARQRSPHAGALTGPGLEAAAARSRSATGSCACATTARLGVLNGTRGTVTAVDRRQHDAHLRPRRHPRARPAARRLPRRGLGRPRLRASPPTRRKG